jgi:hypothetical protein
MLQGRIRTGNVTGRDLWERRKPRALAPALMLVKAKARGLRRSDKCGFSVLAVDRQPEA